MKQGMFITVEGPEGAGKTTVVQLLVQELQKEGCQQQTYVHTIDIGIRSDDNLVVPEVIHILLDVESRL